MYKTQKETFEEFNKACEDFKKIIIEIFKIDKLCKWLSKLITSRRKNV